MRILVSKYGCAKVNTPSILLTGIQPTGDLHIGNYLGAVINMLKFQDSPNYAQRYLMIADYHSLTTAFAQDHGTSKYAGKIGYDTLHMAKVLLGSGVRPESMCLFVQSQVSAHLQLAWIFSCLGPQHWLNTMIQYKEKGHQNSSVGLYTYPTLMAADILLYKATHVPVGHDQIQHIELSNRYGQRFNKLFKTSFFSRINYVPAVQPRIMSLSDPSKKMSKSDPTERSRIGLSDSEQQIRQKIRRAVTDAQGSIITHQPQRRPGLANLLGMYSAITGKDINTIVSECQTNSTNIQQLKELLASALVEKLTKIQVNMSQLSDQTVRDILKQGAKTAEKTARSNLNEIKRILNIYH